MLRLALILLCVSVPLLRAAQKCAPDSHGVRRYNGKPCASTTHYDDGHRGSCGCGPTSSDTPFSWNLNELVTAPSQKYFDLGGDRQWCGNSCGKCVKLTPTGGFVPNEGRAPHNNQGHVFMVTNDCPIQGNQEWCGISDRPGRNKHNSHGYEVHFDLQNRVGQATKLGWDNPEVVWEEVNCPSHFHNLWSQCECHSQGK
ncbi:endoglucanase-like [Littorina saxatilis]|uniref:Cellulase n=1 Tax=Littorina saxatilis TaxID=31220 RepID=A0AAN9GDJ0_9CAEN